MATIRGVAAVANRTFVIGIVNDNATAGLFGTVTQDTAHINRRRTTFIGTRCMNIAYIIGGSNTAIIGKAANTADVGITRNITCIIAAGNYRMGMATITGSTGITLDDIKSFFISQNFTIAIRCLRHVNFTDDAANIGSLCRQLRLSRLSMHITAVATGFNTHRRTVQIACYTANITGDVFFFILVGVVITAGDFISKAAIAFDAAGSHNIAAVVNSVQNAVILFICIIYICCTKITGNTAYVHSTADIAFYVIGIGDIAVFSTADNTADVACCIMVETSRIIFAGCFRHQCGAYIRFVGYIPQLTASTAAHNAADVGCTYLSHMSARKGTVIIHPTAIICMINIIVSSIAVGFDNAFVGSISNGSIIGNTADDAANIIATLNSIIVNQRILRAANSRIFCFTNHAADIIRIVGAIIYTGNFTKVIGALVPDTVFLIIGQLAALHIANQAANIAKTADITSISQVRQLTAAAVRLNGTGSISKAIGTPCIILSITDDTTDIVFTADLQRTVDALDRGVHRMTDKGTGISIAALYRYAVITGNQRYIAHDGAVSKAKKACSSVFIITVINAQAKDRIVKAIKLALEGIFLRSADRSLVTVRQVNGIAQGIMVPHAPTMLFADIF